MKSPKNYGSENEETNFIRRVADPDRPNAKRRQKKRLALAGAATLLIGASTAVGYVTLQSNSVETPVKQQLTANLVVPDFVDSLGDPYYPSFDELDEDGDGIVSYDEYMKDLHEVWDQDRVDIANSDLPDVVKEDLNSQLDAKIVSDSACVKKAMVPTKKKRLTFNRSTVDSLYYMLEVYCFDTPISVPEKYMKMFPDTQAPAPPPAPVIPAIPAPPVVTDAATSAPIDISTPGGDKTITLVGPPVDGKQTVDVDTGGIVITTTVKVEETTSGGEKLNITIPGGGTTTVTVPANNIPNSAEGSKSTGTTTTGTQMHPSSGGSNGGYSPDQQTSTGLQSVDIDTTYGRWTVVLNGPGKWEGTADLTIYKHDGSAPEKQSVDISPRADGSQFVHIFTGDENKMVVFPPLTKTTSETTTPSNPSSGGSTNGFPSGPSHPLSGGSNGGYSSTTTTTTTGLQSVDIDTTYGRWTVVLNGPGKWEGTADLTIYKHDGSAPEKQSVDISPRADGSQFVHIFTGDENKMVVFPPLTKTTSETTTPSNPSSGGSTNGFPSGPSHPLSGGSNGGYSSTTTTTTTGLQSVDIDTTYGRWTVVLNGPGKWEGTADLTIYKHDGSAPEKQSVDISPRADGSQFVHIFTGDENKMVVFPPLTKTTSETTTPSNPSSGGSTNGFPSGPSHPLSGGSNGGYSSTTTTTTTGLQSVDIDTTYGRWTVVLNGPGKWEGTADLTIYKHDGSAPEKQSVDISPRADGSQFVHIFTGDENKMVVFPPLTKTTSETTTPSNPSSGGSTNGFPSGPSHPLSGGSNGGYSSTTTTTTTGLQSVDIDTTYGRWTVVLNGPGKWEGTADLTIYKHDGSAPEKQSVDISPRADGSQFVHIFTGDENKMVVFPPLTKTTSESTTPSNPSARGSGSGFPSTPEQFILNGNQAVAFETSSGRWTVELNGPSMKGTDFVKITVYIPGGSNEVQDVPVTMLADGSQLVYIVADGEKRKVVFAPGSNSGGDIRTYGETGGHGIGIPPTYPVAGGSGNGGLRSLDIDTSYGRWTVVLNGPGKWEGTADITIYKHDGSAPEKQEVDWTPNADGSTKVYLWTGAESKDLLFPPLTTTTDRTTTPSNPSAGGSGSGISSTSQQFTLNGNPAVAFETSSGRWTVELNGPSRKGTDFVKITVYSPDGSNEVQDVPVTMLADGAQLVYAVADGEKRKVVFAPGSNNGGGGSYNPSVPSTTGSGSGKPSTPTNPAANGKRSVEIDTPSGRWTVVLDGPGNVMGTADITILKQDGSSEKQTVDISNPMTDGSMYIYLWTGDDNKKVIFPPPSQPVISTASKSEAGSNEGIGKLSTTDGKPSVDVDTSSGVWTVVFESLEKPDHTIDLTILKHDGSDPVPQGAEVVPGSDGTKFVYIWTADDKKKVPLPPTSILEDVYSNQASGSTHDWSSNSRAGGNGGSSSPLETSVDVAIPDGVMTVQFHGPPTGDNKQSVTVISPEGTFELVLDVSLVGNGEKWVNIPLQSGNKAVQIPGYGGTNTGTQSQVVNIETPKGNVTVETDGPIINGQQNVNITKPDGTSTMVTVDVVKTNDGKTALELPSGPEGQTTLVTLPTADTPSPADALEKPRVVVLETSEGIVKVLFYGLITDGKQSVTVLKFFDDSLPQQMVLDVFESTVGKNTVKIPTGPGTEVQYVAIPPFEGPIPNVPNTDIKPAPTPPEVIIDTPEGPAKVLIDGPVIDNKQDVTIVNPNGDIKTTTVDVVPNADGKNDLIIPGPDGTTTTVTAPTSSTGSGSTGGSKQEQQTVAINTKKGEETVTLIGPVVDGKQDVTITTPKGETIEKTVDVIRTSDGKNAIEVPTGPEGQSTIITIPQSGTSSGSTFESQASSQAAAPATVVDTPHGSATVTANGPVINGKQIVTITTDDGKTITTLVDATTTKEGDTKVDLPTGPGGTTTSVTVSTTSTAGSGQTTGGDSGQTTGGGGDNMTGSGKSTTDIMSDIGINNVDKNFMSMNEFQVQIGAHFSQKIKGLEKQTKDEEAEADKLLGQLQKLEDCIVMASNKFGYYGVYEQAPYFQDAVDWIDNDCLKQ